jgi:tetratricopeptide (TPR) repeat protein
VVCAAGCARFCLLLLIVFVFRCILELHAISSKISDSGGRFEITMPAHSRESFLRATSADVSKYFSLLSSVSAEQSTCSRDVDKESIHNAIRDSIGFDSLNRSIYSVMTNWVIAQIQAFSCGMKDANEMAMVQRMKALGIILCETGRYEQALFVFQEASKTWSTFRNVAPLSLGTDVNSVDSQISRQIIRIHVHLGQYALAQQFHDEAIKRCSETRNLRIFHTLGIDMDELANTFPAEPGTADFDIVDTSDQLNFYHRLIFSDADDPEFLEACGLSNVDYGKLQSAMDDPHLNLQLKITSFQIKINRLPAKHPWIASAMLRLAHAHFEVDQCEEALPLLRRALPFLRRLPLCHPNVILALLLLSACLIKDGALSHAASAAEEAQTLCKKAVGDFADAIALPVELVSAAEQAVVLCRDATFQLNLSSENSDVSNGCIAQFIAVVKNIGTDEARMERVIINRGRDAADQVLERIMPKVQAAMDEKQKAEGGPVIDV